MFRPLLANLTLIPTAPLRIAANRSLRSLAASLSEPLRYNAGVMSSVVHPGQISAQCQDHLG
jgi:hypothetical protein